jgi:RimJ/RimL family protein N-acetyltransferase
VNAAPTLAGDGIVLRPLLVSDAPALFVALSDARTQRFRRADAHKDVAETERYIIDTLERSRAAWAITENGGEALGRLALREPEPLVGEFGIVLRPAAQGRGLGTKAITLAEDWAFDTLGFSKLRADIDAGNAASIALFSHCGYAQEAYLPAHRTTKLGLRDSVILSKSARGHKERG